MATIQQLTWQASSVLKWEVAGPFDVKKFGVKFKVHYILVRRPFSAPAETMLLELLREFNGDREKTNVLPILQRSPAPFLNQLIYFEGVL